MKNSEKSKVRVHEDNALGTGHYHEIILKLGQACMRYGFQIAAKLPALAQIDNNKLGV